MRSITLRFGSRRLDDFFAFPITCRPEVCYLRLVAGCDRQASRDVGQGDPKQTTVQVFAMGVRTVAR